jgi:formate dehydrogenase
VTYSNSISVAEHVVMMILALVRNYIPPISGSSAYLINTARGKICDRDAVARACESGQLAGYAGDVWFPQPAPREHPWRSMPHHGMTPHISGTSLSAQARYAAGAREILECYFDGRPIRDEYLIVEGGKLAGAGAHSYSAGDATGGAEEAARFGESAT